MNAEESVELMAAVPAEVGVDSKADWTFHDGMFTPQASNGERSRPGNEGALGEPGFETPAHRAEFAQWLRRRMLPLKFAYTSTAAMTHDRLSKSSGYQHVIGPVQDEVRALLNAAPLTDGMPQIVEIGPGNGLHSAALLQSLAEEGWAPKRYLALDFSTTLLTMACSHIAGKAAHGLQISGGVWDVEEGPSSRVDDWRIPDDPLVFCFLGNTVGNVEDPRKVLSNIAGSARSGDVLVMSVTLQQDDSDDGDPLLPYATEVFHSAALEMFRLADIDLDDVRLALSFEDGAVTGTVEILRPITFDGVRVTRGERVRCFLSRRFTARQVRALLSDAGWVLLDESDGGGHLITVAARK